MSDDIVNKAGWTDVKDKTGFCFGAIMSCVRSASTAMTDTNKYFLILLETSGNQNYIFRSNKLKENVGASELTHRVGTQFILEAVKDGGGANLWDNDVDQLRANLSDAKRNKPIEDNGNSIEVVLATSGKALILTKSHEKAVEIIQDVTLRTLRKAPGIDICGVISDGFSWDSTSLHKVVAEVHEKFEVVRSSRRSPEERFQMIPMVEPCRTSGLPSAEIVLDGDRRVGLSHESKVKRQNVKSGIERINKTIQSTGFSLEKDLNQLEKHFDDLDWVGVVHADGNGLGQIMMKFHEHSGKKDASKNRGYVKKIRGFSLALDICTEKAFKTALTVFPDNVKRKLPLVPLVLGGDDLTVICHGRHAIAFARKFLTAFEEETAKDSAISEIAEKALGRGNLSSCAGVAIIKPHFPFFSGYGLAEQLITSAKDVKKIVKKEDVDGKKTYPCSAIDFHILYDTSDVDISAIRDKLIMDEGKTSLTAKPYVVTELDDSWKDDVTAGQQWAEAHHISGLDCMVKAIKKEESG